MIITEEIADRADQIQEDMHIKIGKSISSQIYSVDQLRELPNYNDFVASYLVNKIAELELKLEEITEV